MAETLWSLIRQIEGKAQMAIDLAKPILDDFQADQGDRGAVAGCFTDAAIVPDEGGIIDSLEVEI